MKFSFLKGTLTWILQFKTYLTLKENLFFYHGFTLPYVLAFPSREIAKMKLHEKPDLEKKLPCKDKPLQSIYARNRETIYNQHTDTVCINNLTK